MSFSQEIGVGASVSPTQDSHEALPRGARIHDPVAYFHSVDWHTFFIDRDVLAVNCTKWLQLYGGHHPEVYYGWRP